MKIPKKKKLKDETEADDDTRPVRFEALAELTNSEVVQQVKNGMSRIAPLELDDEGTEEASY